MIWDCYQATGGYRRLTKPLEYLGLSAVWIDACNVIESELQEISKYGNE